MKIIQGDLTDITARTIPLLLKLLHFNMIWWFFCSMPAPQKVYGNICSCFQTESFKFGTATNSNANNDNNNNQKKIVHTSSSHPHHEGRFNTHSNISCPSTDCIPNDLFIMVCYIHRCRWCDTFIDVIGIRHSCIGVILHSLVSLVECKQFWYQPLVVHSFSKWNKTLLGNFDPTNIYFYN